MRVVSSKKMEAESMISASRSAQELSLFSPQQTAEISYNELATPSVVEKDILSQVHDNLQLLQDLQARVAFVMREVRYVLKVD